ncbi:MAG: FAD-binding protein [Planctomycetota bacterium]|nr:FAD-binding protein [Planctomycetota bacterium]
MDQEHERIEADLRGLLDGEVRCDDVFVQMYASDASLYEIRPLGVVRPRGAADVAACVRYAAENHIPLHARGAGSGIAGDSLGPGLILDFSHSMRRIVSFDDDTVRVQPGVVLAQLNRHLAPYGRLIGPDPSTRSVTTLGSVIALDAHGSHFPKYGSARDHVLSLQAVTADGQIIEFGRQAVVDEAAEQAHPQRQQVVRRVADLLRREERVIADHTPRTLVNHCGYQVHDVLADGQLDLAKLLTGSQGTLALITEATLKTVPRPAHRGLALLFFERLDAAVRGALEIADMAPSACDLMDRRLLTIARELDVRYQLLIPAEAEALLLIEQQGEDALEVGESLRQIVVRLVRRRHLAFDARVTLEKDERDFYWRLSRRVTTSLYRLKGNTQALPFVEDIAVPPQSIPDFLVRLQNVLKAHAVTASLFGHVAHGQLHVRPFLDPANPEHVRLMPELAASLYEQVLKVGGTISGERAVGLSRTWFVRQQCGPLYDVFAEIKRIFDPQNIFNPGKIVAEVPQPLNKNLRPVRQQAAEAPAAASVLPVLPLQLVWKGADIEDAARNCNGCGRCRTLSPEERMCPIFRFSPREEAAPRAKANLVRAMITGQLGPQAWTGEAFKAVADLCVNCHQCRFECPASVDIPQLMLEAKAQHVAQNSLDLTDWLLARPELLSAWGSRFSVLANWMVRNRRMRWLLEKVLGIAQGRKLPRFQGQSFMQQAHKRRLTRPTRRAGHRVLYFVDVYANWHDTALARAFIAILKHNGAGVYVHPHQVPAGMAAISVGALDRARHLAERNVAVLADAVRQGYQIVTTEPAAALCLKHDYPLILDDDDARVVAENTSEACS